MAEDVAVSAEEEALSEEAEKLAAAGKRTQKAERQIAQLKAQVASLEAKLETATQPIVALTAKVEALVYSKVASLSNRNEALERRLKNARFVCEASEELAADAVLKQLAAESEAVESARQVQRLMIHLDGMRRRDARKQLSGASGLRLAEISACETQVRNLSSDPEIELPIGVNKRKELDLLSGKRLVTLRRDQKSATEMLQRLEETEKMEASLRRAASGGDLEAVRKWCGRGARASATDENGASALDYACGNGHADIVRMLCREFGADPNGDSMGLGALSAVMPIKKQAIALACGVSRPVILAARRGHMDVLKVLLEEDTSILAGTDENGSTALHASAQEARLEITRHLLDAGARVDLIDKVGSTPLHDAAGCSHGDVDDLVQIVTILAHQDQLNLCNGVLETPLDTARRGGRRPLILKLKELTCTAAPAFPPGPPIPPLAPIETNKRNLIR